MGNEAVLGPLKLLQGPIQAVILLLMHAFRLGLTLGVACLFPLEESLLFADSRPDYFVQTLLDKQFDFEGSIDDGAIIPMLIRGSKVWPRIRLAVVLRFAGSRSTGRSADVVLISAPFLVPAIHAQPVGHPPKGQTWDSSNGKWINASALIEEQKAAAPKRPIVLVPFDRVLRSRVFLNGDYYDGSAQLHENHHSRLPNANRLELPKNRPLRWNDGPGNYEHLL